MSYDAGGQGERILREAVAAANAYNESVVSSFEPKKIPVTQISHEYRAEWLFGETYWQPQRIAIDWPEILSS